MLEIVSEMVFCLVMALLLGFSIGFLLAESLYGVGEKPIFGDKSSDFDASESLEKSKKIDKLEKRCSEKNRL